MAKINILSKEVAQLIAAGEVVERPSSVIKEMIENSIDAGATDITIEIKNGGLTYMRITDNGIGIEKDDVESVFISHATSKIKQSDDLAHIGTLGFRGEAMASIASVARVEMLTKTKADDFGSQFVIHGGERISFEQAGCPDGTTIVVRDLFYNTPARMKFLKKDVTEANAVAGVVDRIALSHPEVSFRFIRDGKQTLMTRGDRNLRNAVYSVCSKDFAANLLEVEYEMNGVSISGLISKPTAGRANRSMQYFFVNGRLVQSRTCFAALEQSYKNSIMVGKFPSCVLNLSVDTSLVDVNVHPAKIEVRFANEKSIFDCVYYGCKSALGSDNSRKEIHFPKQAEQGTLSQVKYEQTTLNNGENDKSKFVSMTADEYKKSLLLTDISAGQAKYQGDNHSFVYNNQNTNKVNGDYSKTLKAITIKAEKEFGKEDDSNAVTSNTAQADEKDVNGSFAVKADESDDFKVIGEAFTTYIIVEIDKELYFIDKHAAHERLLFEELRANAQTNSQIFLSPVAINLSKEEYSVIISNLDLLTKAGFGVEDFGSSSVIVRECPQILSQGDITETICEIAGKLISGKRDVSTHKLDWIFHSTACRAAVKAGDKTSPYEMERFVKKLLSMPDIKFCPHGRPVMVKMSKHEIEKQFGRA